jgi:hypothetical protein
VLSLLPGGEYRFISAGDLALTDKGDLMTVLGYSENWIEWNSIRSELDKDSSNFEDKTLKKHVLTPELVSDKQKVIGLFYDPEQRARQDLMIISPSNLVPLSKGSEAEKVALDSPMMVPEVAKHLLGNTRSNSECVDAQIIKAVSWQIEVLGQKYLNFLKEHGLLHGLIKQLWNASSDGQKVEVIPLNWMEAKIQKIRKIAAESTRSLELDKWETIVYLLNNKELIFKRTHPLNQNVMRFNAPLMSAVNMHRVKETIPFSCTTYVEFQKHCQCGDYQQAVKTGFVTVPFSTISDLNDSALQLLCTADGIITSQADSLDVKEFFNKMYEIFKKDQEKKPKMRKYQGLMSTIMFFVEQEDFENCHRIPDMPKPAAKTNERPIETFMKQLKEWGGVDTDKLVHYLKDTKEVDYSNIDEVIGFTEEAILAMQTQEDSYQKKVSLLTKNGQSEELTKLEKDHSKTWEDRAVTMSAKAEAIAKAGKESMDDKPYSEEFKLEAIPDFEKDEDWKKGLDKAMKTISKKPESRSEQEEGLQQKTEEKMTKLMFSVITDFDNKSLAIEHSKAVKRALLQIQKDCFFKILSNSDMNELIPELIGSEEERAKFIRFL